MAAVVGPAAAAYPADGEVEVTQEPFAPFSVQRHERESALVLVLHGELDVAYAPELRQELGALAGDGRKLILDLRRLDFIDSSGIAVLLDAARDARRDGWDLGIIRGGSPEVERVLSLTGLDDLLPFTDPG
jgi:stage II sporulation protein AA (anti-sigma F factor antagonist)